MIWWQVRSETSAVGKNPYRPEASRNWLTKTRRAKPSLSVESFFPAPESVSGVVRFRLSMFPTLGLSPPPSVVSSFGPQRLGPVPARLLRSSCGIFAQRGPPEQQAISVRARHDAAEPCRDGSVHMVELDCILDGLRDVDLLASASSAKLVTPARCARQILLCRYCCVAR
jgi:hypothetical protein